MQKAELLLLRHALFDLPQTATDGAPTLCRNLYRGRRRTRVRGAEAHPASSGTDHERGPPEPVTPDPSPLLGGAAQGGAWSLPGLNHRPVRVPLPSRHGGTTRPRTEALADHPDHPDPACRGGGPGDPGLRGHPCSSTHPRERGRSRHSSLIAQGQGFFTGIPPSHPRPATTWSRLSRNSRVTVSNARVWVHWWVCRPSSSWRANTR